MIMVALNLYRYAVYLFTESNPEQQWNSITAMNRVCGTAKKTMLIAIPSENLPNDDETAISFQYILLKRWVPESNRE